MDNKKVEPKHVTFWWKSKIDRNKPYYVLFNTWTNIRTSWSCTGYDTLEEALEEAKLLNIYYSSTPKPERKPANGDEHYDEYRHYTKWKFDYSDGKCWWGYAVLDMLNEKFIKVVNQFNGSPLVGKEGFTIQSKPTLENYDVYFRKDDEVPVEYNWKGPHDEEYKGWLQFRWGDGKNAIGYVEPEKKDTRPGHDEYVDIYDEATDSYKRTKLRVVVVGWDDPLPKKEKGIYYRRPNKEPVIFPIEFGYDGDYSMWPWSLAEENNDYHYEDDKGDKNTLGSLLDNETLKKLINVK